MIPSTLITSIETEKAHGILSTHQNLDEYGLARVLQWAKNWAWEHGYALQYEIHRRPTPEPGLIGDPRR